MIPRWSMAQLARLASISRALSCHLRVGADGARRCNIFGQLRDVASIVYRGKMLAEWLGKSLEHVHEKIFGVEERVFQMCNKTKVPPPSLVHLPDSITSS